MRRTALALAGILVLLTGCATQSSSFVAGSRAELYDSLEELVQDSSAIVVARVLDQAVATDIDDMPFTLSSVEIQHALNPTGLGPASPGGNDVVALSQGDNVIVRQIGDGASASEATFLDVGATYLLFLTTSGLPGELASHFYVVGVTAGIYEPVAGAQAQSSTEIDEMEFRHVGEMSPDRLPSNFTTADLP